MITKRMVEWAEGATVLSTEPWLVYISLTNHCNNKCRVCAQPLVMREDKGLMSFDLFKKVVSQLPSSVKKIYLFKQGEPFINKNLEKCVEYLRKEKPDVYISIHTNGQIAGIERIKKIINLVDSIGISISATSKEIYENVHGVDGFDAVMKNLRDISELNKNIPFEKRPHIFIDYIYQERNKVEKEEDVVQFFKSKFPGLSSVDFHWVYNFQGEIEEGNIEANKKVPEKEFPCCVFPWSAFTVCYDGKVSYCFVEPRETNFMGDLNNDSFTDIWNGEKYVQFRERMVSKKFSELMDNNFHCKDCSWLWSMKSQSPKNLNGGYSIVGSENLTGKVFGDILEMPLEKVEAVADTEFNLGEVSKALGLYYYLESVTAKDSIREKIQTCNKILGKYKNISSWKDAMVKEGIDIENRECRYYKIGRNDG
ncbi:MAG: radical SAM protein [Bacteroidetes bacterium]|nr:radical SAM protein [Bacteroidota bacterium]